MQSLVAIYRNLQTQNQIPSRSSDVHSDDKWLAYFERQCKKVDFVPDHLPCDNCIYIITSLAAERGRKVVIGDEQRLKLNCNPTNIQCHCMNCTLQFFISSKSYQYCSELILKDGIKYFRLLNYFKVYGFHRNYLITQRIINNKKMFCQLFIYLSQVLIDSVTNKNVNMLMIEDVGRNLLYKLMTFTKYLKKKHIRWILKYCNTMLSVLLKNCCQTLLNVTYQHLLTEYRLKRTQNSVLVAISGCVDLIMFRIKQYNIYIYYQLIGQYCKGNVASFDEHPYHGFQSYIPAMVKNHHQQIHKGQIKCGNDKCNKQYLIHKYGKKFKTKFEGSDANYFQNGWKDRKHEKQLKIINKWYICGGCKMIYYCCLRCQKVAWSRQNHKAHCLQLSSMFS